MSIHKIIPPINAKSIQNLGNGKLNFYLANKRIIKILRFDLNNLAIKSKN